MKNNAIRLKGFFPHAFLVWALMIVSQQVRAEDALLFLTWRDDPCTTMDVRWLRPAIESGSPQVAYREGGTKRWVKAIGEDYLLPESEYVINNVHLEGLLPDTLYEFKLHNSETIRKFRTLSPDPKKPLRFVVGGDVYHRDLKPMVATHRQAANTDPDFAILGGDIAYSCPRWKVFRESSQRWIEFIDAWAHTMIAPDGRCIPLLAAIGNHDTIGRFNQTPDEAPGFYALFAYPSTKANYVLDVGEHTSLVFLDTGHTQPVADQQEWLEEKLAERSNRFHRFAVYHVPGYPAYRKMHKRKSPKVREFWVPLFEKYKLHVAFEHHDHAYKRSHPLLGGEPHEEGVLYLGDGAWGAKPRKPSSLSSRPYLAVAEGRRHFILVEIDQSHRQYRAIGSDGEVFDRTEQMVGFADEKSAFFNE